MERKQEGRCKKKDERDRRGLGIREIRWERTEEEEEKKNDDDVDKLEEEEEEGRGRQPCSGERER